MNILAVLVLVISSGWGSQYHSGIAESVIHVRQTRNVSHRLPLNLPDVDGYIAVRDCNHIGEVWWLRPVGGKVESFLVIDCAGSDETRDWMDRNQIIGEIDHLTADRWQTVGRGIKVERVLSINRGVARIK